MKKANQANIANDKMDKSNTEFPQWLKAFRQEEREWVSDYGKEKISISDEQARNAYDNGYTAYGTGCGLYHLNDKAVVQAGLPWQENPLEAMYG